MLSEEARKAGKLLAAEGLKPSSAGMRIRLANGKRTAVDGPFAETKELIGGFAIFEVASKQEAVDLAQRFVDVHVNAGVTDFEMEMRPLRARGLRAVCMRAIAPSRTLALAGDRPASGASVRGDPSPCA